MEGDRELVKKRDAGTDEGMVAAVRIKVGGW